MLFLFLKKDLKENLLLTGFKKFKETQKNDEIKNNFCKTNNIKLIRISYKEIKKIENILEEEITS